MNKKYVRILFLIFSIIFFIFAFTRIKPVETNLLKAFLTPHSKIEEQIINLANLSSTQLNVILASKDYDNLQELNEEFSNKIEKLNFPKTDFTKAVDIYKSYPNNFLTDKTRNLIKNKNYKIIDENSLQSLYNPLGIYILPPDKDPYLLSTDFVNQNLQFIQDENKELNGKFYSLNHLEIKSNQDMKRIIKIQKELNLKNTGEIYLTGTPIHSYLMSSKSSFEINLICIVSILALILLCKIYFKTCKILIPISLSILYGTLLGYGVSIIIFSKLHILTFVFSTSLIGISLDYSLHYFLTHKDNGFVKSLTSSMFTTVFAFLILYFSGVEILQQIAIFTAFGLLGVYLFVIIVLPAFKDYEDVNRFKSYDISKFKPVILTIIGLVIILGSVKLKFNDNIKNLYVPPKNLLQSEILYRNVFNPQTPDFVVVSGNNIDEIIQKEEVLSLKFDKENVKYLGLNNFISSTQRQLENQKLVKTLYAENLEDYKKSANLTNIKSLQVEKNIYNPQNFPMKSKFMLDKNTSFIMVFNPQNVKNTNLINVTESISKILKDFRLKYFQLIPIVFIGLFVFLVLLYGLKNAFKISISPFLGALFSITLLSLFGEEINLFHILALFLIIGFSLDYSIFRINGCDKSKDAVFISCISTIFSFLLLSFTSFKLISSLGTVLWIGILSSYILSLILIPAQNKTSC